MFDEQSSKKLKTIINIAYLAILVALFYLATKYFFWTIFPFILAFAVAAMLQKPKNFFVKKKLPSGIVSVILTLLVFLVLLGLVALGGAWLVSQIKNLVNYFTKEMSQSADIFEYLRGLIPQLGILKRLPSTATEMLLSGIDSLQKFFNSGDLVSRLTSMLSKFSTTITGAVSTVPSFLIGFVVSIVSTCFITTEFGDIKAFVLRQFKSEESKLKAVKTKTILKSSFGKMVKAYALIMLITATEVSIGLVILKLAKFYDGQIILVGVLTAIVDIIPVLGTGTVLIPWAVISLINGNIGMGIGLIIMYVVILIIRQVIEPKLVAGQVGISPVVTIISMFIGAKYFGLIGFFIVPLSVIMIKLLNDEGIINLYVPSKTKEEPVEPAAVAAEQDNPTNIEENEKTV